MQSEAMHGRAVRSGTMHTVEQCSVKQSIVYVAIKGGKMHGEAMHREPMIKQDFMEKSKATHYMIEEKRFIEHECTVYAKTRI
jgi:hypothetical protein